MYIPGINELSKRVTVSQIHSTPLHWPAIIMSSHSILSYEFLRSSLSYFQPLLPPLLSDQGPSPWTLRTIILHSFSPSTIFTFPFATMSVIVLLLLEIMNWSINNFGKAYTNTFPIQGERKQSDPKVCSF